MFLLVDLACPKCLCMNIEEGANAVDFLLFEEQNPHLIGLREYINEENLRVQGLLHCNILTKVEKSSTMIYIVARPSSRIFLMQGDYYGSEYVLFDRYAFIHGNLGFCDHCGN